MRRIDLIGRRFNRLVVTADAAKRGPLRYVKCRCDCGAETEVYAGNLARGNTGSCGCLQAESRVKHGHTSHAELSPTYTSWSMMIQRCTNPKSTGYKDYGARGITVCDEWMDFGNFLRDMGERPNGLTLERMDNESGYSKDNCRWATRAEQQQNRRTTRSDEVAA